MVGFVRFLCKLYAGSRSVIFQSFGRWNFFPVSFKRRKIPISDFLDGKGYYFASCLYSKLGKEHVFALIDGTPFSWRACSEIFYQLFFGQFSSNNAEIFEYFWNRFDIVHCVSSIWRSFSTNTFVGSVCLLLSYIGDVLVDRGRFFQWTKIFRQRVFDEINWKPRFFQRASVTLPRFSSLFCHLWHLNEA